MATIYARLTSEGTAASETAVCIKHYADSLPVSDTVTMPVDASGNELLCCIICGLPSDGWVAEDNRYKRGDHEIDEDEDF
jgi:hypothetical protein